VALASEIVRIENADPADASSPAELDRANLARAFALTAAEALDAEAFGKRLLGSCSPAAIGPPSSPTGWPSSARAGKVEGHRPGRGAWQGGPVLGGERRRGLGGETL
jgi:hypothetical protein